jgi:hypothetical protein
MTLDERFRSTREVHARRFDEETIVLDLSRGEYFSLNEVGAAIWERLSKGLSLKEVVRDVVEIYEVDADAAERDVLRLAGDLVDAGLLARVG